MFLQGCSQQESVRFGNLYKHKGLWTKKFSTVPFSGTTTGRVQTTIQDGKIIGEFLLFYKDGSLETKCFYNKDGEKSGSEKRFWSNGKLIQEVLYFDGEILEDYDVYSSSGDYIYTKKIFKDGTCCDGSYDKRKKDNQN